MTMPNRAFIRQVGYRKWAFRWLRRQVGKRLLHRPSRITLPTGLTFTAPIESRFGSEVLYTAAVVDYGSERFLAGLAAADSDFLDVGAHIGYYSAYLAPLVRHVYAFEPDPRNFASLALNLPANATHVHAAVSSSSGRVRLDQTRDSGEISDSGIEVSAVTIDDFVAGASDVRPLLVKLDIEGHEMAAIAGMQQTVDRFQPLILTEFSRGAVNTPVALADWLEQHNYTAYAYTQRHRTGTPPPLDMAALSIRPMPVKMLFLAPPRLQAVFKRASG
jgi:FkbM family methyltransferase